jgi:hypothetical protein
MRIGGSDASPGLRSEHAGSPGDDLRSPYAIAQDGLSELVEASVQAQRVEAMQAALRVELIFLTMTFCAAQRRGIRRTDAHTRAAT